MHYFSLSIWKHFLEPDEALQPFFFGRGAYALIQLAINKIERLRSSVHHSINTTDGKYRDDYE